MTAYFEYLREFLTALFGHLGKFFGKTFGSPWTDVGNNFNEYNSLLSAHSGQFGFWGWFFWVLFLVLFIGLVAGLLFLIFLLLRKYVRFVKKELNQEELQRQVDRLNYELYLQSVEKDRILGLQLKSMGASSSTVYTEEEKEEVNEISSRFPKLTRVDNTYKNADTNIEPKEGLSLEELCNSFRNFAATQPTPLYYTIATVRQLFAGLATSKLIILEGISGTGKTSLATVLGKFFNFASALIPVQPSWKDKSELIGYYNEFTKKFNETEFLRALYVTTYRKDLNVIILDEMNLARIEYYFAEFLSIMEKKETADWLIDLVPAPMPGDPVNLKDGGKLLIPQNVVFFGTANNDDSTFTISDKVYDRAISIFFDDKGRAFEAEPQESISVPYSQLERLFKEAQDQYPISESMLDKFEQLDNFVIKKFKLAFGNRIMMQLEKFIPNYVACGGTEVDGFDFIFTNKILKKFEALNLAFLKDKLKELDAFLDKLYGKGNFQMAHTTIENMINNY